MDYLLLALRHVVDMVLALRKAESISVNPYFM